MKPGLYYSLPFDEYKTIPAVNCSTLKAIKYCPAGLTMLSEATEALNFGTATHDYVLEGKLPVIAPKCDRRTKEGKVMWADFQSKNVGKVIVTDDEWETIKEMHGSIYAHPEAAQLFSKGRSEVTAIFRYQDLLCKARFDWLTPENRIVDLKTTQSASVSGFRKSVQTYDYHLQNYWYCLALNELGIKHKGFKFVAVEKSAPYMTNVFDLEDDWVSAGATMACELIDKYVDIKKTDKLAAYTSPTTITLACPAYLKGE